MDGFALNAKKLIFENYPLEREKIIEKLKINRFRKWLRILNGSLNDYHSDIYFVPGTDDPLIIDELIEKNKKVNLLNNKIIKINNSFSLLGFSYSSYNCQSISEEHRFKSFYRNISEENFRDKFWELISKYEDKNDLSHYIFCIPYPPKNTNLDYDSNKRIHFGCEKLKEIIDITKPKYSLHSFIYENRYDSINETVLLNPGSYFNNGKIVFYVIDYKAGIFKHLHYNNDPFKNINLQREDYNSNSINKNYVDLIRYIIDIIPFGATFVKIERLIKHLIKMKNETILIEQKNEINNLINRLLKNKK